ncbi:MAG TPA: VOC family protein [Gammaproteobacteria bacterium]|nr:VOC family protein [Gammaproteobacteria bacterium]
MFSNGNVTVYVSDMDAAIGFFTNALGFTLTNRFGGQWATIHAGPSYWTTEEVGAGLIVGLHPRSAKAPKPGTVGSIGFGVETYEPLETVIPELTKRGVRVTGEIIRFEAGNAVAFEDADGHASFVHEFPPFMLAESDLQERSNAAGKTPAAMLSGGLAIVYVSSMDDAVRFYSKTLGLKLTNRFGDNLATVEAGDLVIAIHPQTENTPKPGTKGSIVLGLVADGSIDRVLSRLAELGVRAAGSTNRSELRGYVEIQDPDGNPIYIYEESVAAYAPEARAMLAASR